MTYQETIRTLFKRAEWLKQRIEISDKRLTHDEKELEALETALDLLADFVDCDGVEV